MDNADTAENDARTDVEARAAASLSTLSEVVAAAGSRIAIVTGATGGIGSAFATELMSEPLDEIWVLGRNEQHLRELCNQHGEQVVPLRCDLTNPADRAALRERLQQLHPRIYWLVNNAGIARMAPSAEMPADEIEKTISLNCSAPALIINMCLPFMHEGAHVLNVSSASAFQPVPYLNLYAATKAFLRSYSRALGVELKPRDITVTAVCPGWVDTNLLPRRINDRPVHFPGLVSPERVVRQALADARRGRDMSVCGLYTRWQHTIVKLLPQKLTMKLWLRSTQRYR